MSRIATCVPLSIVGLLFVCHYAIAQCGGCFSGEVCASYPPGDLFPPPSRPLPVCGPSSHSRPDSVVGGKPGENLVLDGLTGMTLQNCKSSPVTFTAHVQGSALFGTEHDVASYPVAPGSFTTIIDPPSLHIQANTQLTTEGIEIDIRNDANVLAQCSLELTVVPDVGIFSDIIIIPVRFCAVEGSPEAEGKSAGQEASGQSLFRMLDDVNNRAWLRDAHILFRSAPASSIPVIEAPRLFPGDVNQKKGDFHVGIGEGDAPEWATKCREAWIARYPEQDGVVVVNVRLLTNTDAAAFANPLAFALQLGNSRNQDLCSEPLNLNVNDVKDNYAFIQDPACYEEQQCGLTVQPTYPSLAHEFGHVLMLGHGNGLDDDHNGSPAGTMGPKRYDSYCDPAGTRYDGSPVEDPVFSDCDSSSMMEVYGRCDNLRPLQVETARAVAKLVPGVYYNYSLNATAKQVQCIRKHHHYDPTERIDGLGGTKADGSHWYLPEDEIIRRVTEGGAWTFYTLVGDRPADVVVATHSGRNYLKTSSDGYAPNNLLSLPDCP